MTSVWSEHATKEGRVYYYNRSTKQSSWEKPADFDGESTVDAKTGATATAAATSTASSTAAGDIKKQAKDAIDWEELWDPKNERAYYYNRATRKTQWLRPENVEIKPYGGAATTASTAAGGSSSSAATKKSEAKVKKADKNSDHASAAAALAAKGEVAKSSGSAAASVVKTATHHEQDEDEGATSSSQRGDDDAASVEDVANETDVQTAADAEKQASQDEALAQHKKRKKSKLKKDRSDSTAGTAADNNHSHGNGSSHWRKKKQQRVAKDGEARMIICDDDDQMQSRPIQEKDTEDGKEAARLLQQLSQPDAIMEMNVLNVINGFLRAHNESNGPEILVEALSSSYRGHAQMVGLMASWLDTLPVSKSALEKKVTYDVAEGAMHESKGGASWDPAEEILYQHLKDVVTHHYEPKLVRKMNTRIGRMGNDLWC